MKYLAGLQARRGGFLQVALLSHQEGVRTWFVDRDLRRSEAPGIFAVNENLCASGLGGYRSRSRKLSQLDDQERFAARSHVNGASLGRVSSLGDSDAMRARLESGQIERGDPVGISTPVNMNFCAFRCRIDRQLSRNRGWRGRR